MITISLDSESWLKKTITVLKDGGLVVFPTDTVYGLLTDATNEEAVKKLIAFKNRPVGKPISMFVPDLKSAAQYVEISPTQQTLLSHMLPGPFTVVLPSLHKASSLLESEHGTLGIRLPDNQQVLELVKQYGKPLTATSANVSGQSPYYSIEDFLKAISQKKLALIDGIVDGGKLPYRKPSTVVDLTTSKLKILRDGEQNWLHHDVYHSKTERETVQIAKDVLKNVEEIAHQQNKGLAFLLQGELGAGKTVFTKSLAQQYDITNIVSPTHVVYYEYEITKSESPYNKLYHFDLYNVQEISELKTLKIENLFDEKSLLFFEWGEKIDAYLETLKRTMRIVYVRLEYKDEGERELHIYF